MESKKEAVWSANFSNLNGWPPIAGKHLDISVWKHICLKTHLSENISVQKNTLALFWEETTKRQLVENLHTRNSSIIERAWNSCHGHREMMNREGWTERHYVGIPNAQITALTFGTKVIKMLLGCCCFFFKWFFSSASCFRIAERAHTRTDFVKSIPGGQLNLQTIYKSNWFYFVVAFFLLNFLISLFDLNSNHNNFRKTRKAQENGAHTLPGISFLLFCVSRSLYIWPVALYTGWSRIVLLALLIVI